jgi:hypothetical protein
MSAIEEAYAEERGYPPYNPRMMVTVLLYACCTGTYSFRSRNLASSNVLRYTPKGLAPPSGAGLSPRSRLPLPCAGGLRGLPHWLLRQIRAS